MRYCSGPKIISCPARLRYLKGQYARPFFTFQPVLDKIRTLLYLVWFLLSKTGQTRAKFYLFPKKYFKISFKKGTVTCYWRGLLTYSHTIMLKSVPFLPINLSDPHHFEKLNRDSHRSAFSL